MADGKTDPRMWVRIYQIKDHAGNVRAEAKSPFLIYTSGACAVWFSGDYYPYGQEATPKSGQSLPSPAPVNLYAGNEFERTNVRMYDFHARWYDQQTGRFGGQDPLAEKYYDLSPYSYCGGDPINFSDPSGLDHVEKNENGEEVWRIPGPGNEESYSVNEVTAEGTRSRFGSYAFWVAPFSSVKDQEKFSENEAFYAQQALTEKAWLQSEAKRAALKRLLEGQRIVEGIDFNPCYEFRLLERNPGLENVYPEFYIILTLASPGAGQVGIGGKTLRGFAKSLLKRNTTKNGTFEIADGVRRAKAAQELGHTSIKAMDHTGKTFQVPLKDLYSPFKSSIDVSTPLNQFRYDRIYNGFKAGDALPPIYVNPGSRGVSIFDVYFIH